MNDQIDRQCIKLHNYRGNENVLFRDFSRHGRRYKSL